MGYCGGLWREIVLKHIEDRRAAGLGAILAELAELDRLRSLIAMLIVEIPAEPMPRLSAFLAWAKDHLAKREACLSAQAKRYKSASHAGAYSKKTVSLPCILLLRTHADPTRAPVDVDMNFNISYNRSVPMWA